jgi:hypothetical protein
MAWHASISEQQNPLATLRERPGARIIARAREPTVSTSGVDKPLISRKNTISRASGSMSFSAAATVSLSMLAEGGFDWETT